MTEIGNKNAILITGAAGLIGRALLSELLQTNNSQLTAQVRSAVKARAQIGRDVDLTRVLLQERDFASISDLELNTLTRGCNVVIHAAGLVHQPQASYEQYELLNVRATQHLAAAAASNGAHTFVFLSSSAVYGAGPFENIAETAPLKTTTPYSVSKLTSETWLKRFAGIPRIIILRPSLVFGEGDRGNLLSLIRQIKSKHYRHIDNGVAGKSVIYAKDLAKAICLCLEKLPVGVHIFNVANPQAVTMKLLADEIAKQVDVSNIASVPSSLARLGLRTVSALMPGKIPITSEQLEKLTTTTTCCVDKLVDVTGFQPKYSLSSALKAEIDWATAAKLI